MFFRSAPTADVTVSLDGALKRRQPTPMFENVRRDLRRAVLMNQDPGRTALLRELFNPGTQAILLYRFGRWADRQVAPLRFALRLLHFPLTYCFAWRAGIYIPIGAEIGPGVVIHTWGGGVFLPCARIGRDLTIIGGGVLMDYDTREIGDEVKIGPGTKVVGKIRIGNRVRTGPNAVIQFDVPDDMIAFGNPARLIRRVVGRPSAGGGKSSGSGPPAH